MLRRSDVLLKKGWTYTPGKLPRGGKNVAFKPKMSEKQLAPFVQLDLVTPERRPSSWQERECQRLELPNYPKAVGFFNAGDNWEFTPEMMFRLFRRNHARAFWAPQHNEKVVVSLMPVVEKDAARGMGLVNEVLAAHVARFGADHVIYNAVMQAAAFARDYDRAKALFDELASAGLVPNAQSYVNMMLAVKLAGRPKAEAEAFFNDAVRAGALHAVVRLDTEFSMWWSQFDRLGSFTSEEGFLAAKEEGAKPRPRDAWAIWGWDKSERKFVTRREYVAAEARRRGAPGRGLYMQGTVLSGYRRTPWFKYQGVRKDELHPPHVSRSSAVPSPPAVPPTKERAGAAY